MKPRLFVATIGTDYEKGVWESLVAATNIASRRENEVILNPIGNRCTKPFQGLALMRNLAIIDGLGLGATHILLADTDILWEDAEALSLMVSTHDVVVPWFNQFFLKDTGQYWRLQEPNIPIAGEPWTKLKWSVFSCIMFNCAIWQEKGVDIRLFHDHLAVAEDEYYCAYLRLFGVELWRRNDSAVSVLRPPTAMWANNKGRITESRKDDHVELKYQRPKWIKKS